MGNKKRKGDNNNHTPQDLLKEEFGKEQSFVIGHLKNKKKK